MICAFLKDGVVVELKDISEEELTPEITSQYSNIIDVTNDSPLPSVGWVFNGSQLIPAPGSAPAAVHKRITKLALRNRFTLQEKIGIQSLLLGTGQTSLALQAWVQDFTVSTYVDLSRPETIAGVNFLEQIGLIAPGRASVILNTDITAEERYKETL